MESLARVHSLSSNRSASCPERWKAQMSGDWISVFADETLSPRGATAN